MCPNLAVNTCLADSRCGPNPSFRYLPPVYYYLGRAQEGLKSPAANDSYKAFLALTGTGGGDPLVADARSRLGSR